MTKSNSNIKNQAYELLKERLINCVYAPGSFLNEAMLAEELGCSRTPIREAISRLEIDQLVKVVPKKGIYVSDISLSDVQQIFQTRLEIEPMAVRMTAGRIPEESLYLLREKFAGDIKDIKNSFRLDTAMHLYIIENCGNRYIIDMMKRVFEDNTRVIISSKQNQVQIHDAKAEHIEILDALIDKDVEKAAELMRVHVESCRRAALDYFYNNASSEGSSLAAYQDILDKIK
ncbi:MAG: GntR family transcriptional regulator [Eubacteriales bacterium]|nr:GntR family transcriptional regulator [Eubacteriales bacterium]